MRIILKLLAAPFVLALTLLVAVLNFAFSFASWVFCALSFLCLIGALFALLTALWRLRKVLQKYFGFLDRMKQSL